MLAVRIVGMARGIILGIVIIVILSVFAVVDCAMTDARRTKVMQKPIWLVVILLLPVIGPLLWLLLGKVGANQTQQTVPQAHPDNVSDRESSHDARIRELEEEMRKLDEEIEQARLQSMGQHPSSAKPEATDSPAARDKQEGSAGNIDETPDENTPEQGPRP